MGVPLNRLNELIRGHRANHWDTALRLAKLLKTDAVSLMNLLNAWDLWHAAPTERRPVYVSCP